MDTYNKCEDWAGAGHCRFNEITMNIFCTNLVESVKVDIKYIDLVCMATARSY